MCFPDDDEDNEDDDSGGDAKADAALAKKSAKKVKCVSAPPHARAAADDGAGASDQVEGAISTILPDKESWDSGKK